MKINRLLDPNINSIESKDINPSAVTNLSDNSVMINFTELPFNRFIILTYIFNIFFCKVWP